MTRLILVLMFAMMAACAKDAPRDRCDFDGDGDSFDDGDLAKVNQAIGSSLKRFDWDRDGYVGGADFTVILEECQR